MQNRFKADEKTVLDRQTGLIQMTGLTWTRLAVAGEKPLSWYDAMETIEMINRECRYGYTHWRMPEIRELECLVDLGNHTPALPSDHRFEGVQAFYWSSTPSQYETRYAWALYLQDGAIGVGFKENAGFYLWPVCG